MDSEFNLDEMNNLAAEVHGFSEVIASAAAAASAIDYNVNAFGLLGALAANGAGDTAARTVAGLQALAGNVDADATTVTASASDFMNTEQTQTDCFRGIDHG